MPEDHEVLGAGDRYEGNTQNISDYDTTIYLDVANIDKNDKNPWGTIYKAIYERYFGEVKLFTRAFINICKIIQMSHKTLQLISRRIKNRIRRNFMCIGDEYLSLMYE